MCEQCLVNPLYYGQVFGNWSLIRARRKGIDMEVGDWGLLKVNDPSFIWKTTPTIDAEYPSDDFYDAFWMQPFDGKSFAEECVSAGFEGTNDYDLHDWLWKKIAEHISNTTPETSEDPFPHLDALVETNYELN